MINIKGQVEIRCSTWEEFLKYINGEYKSLQLQFIQDSYGYELFCIDNTIVYMFTIWDYDTEKVGVDKETNNTNYTDFVNNYKDISNRKLKSIVELHDRGEFNISKSRTTIRSLSLATANGITPTVGTFTFPYEACIISGYTFADWDNFNKNDTYCVYFYPPNDGAIGVVTEGVSSGNNEVKVSSTVLDNILCADFVLFDQMYEVISKSSNSITLDKNLTTSLSTNDPVKLRVPMVYHANLLQNTTFIVTPKTFGSVVLSVGSTMRIEYHHYSTPSSSWNLKFSIVYFYGER